jgi:hypothetical protein
LLLQIKKKKKKTIPKLNNGDRIIS